MLAGRHLADQAAVAELLVADDVDPADAGFRPLVDLEHHIDAVLVELDDLRLDRGGVAALAAIELDDPGDVGAGARAGEDLPRRKPDFGQDLVVLDPPVALEHDPVDHRILAHLDDEIAGIGAGDLTTSANSSVASRSRSAVSSRSLS